MTSSLAVLPVLLLLAHSCTSQVAPEIVTEKSGKFVRTYSVQRGTKIRDGAYREMREDGSVSATGNYRNGQKNGVWTTFDPSGDKIFETPFVDGKIHGTETQYAPRHLGMSSTVVEHNCVVATTTFVLGVEHGPHREQAPDGTPRAEYAFVFGMRHGPAKFYYLGGKISSAGEYAFDKRVGHWSEWEPNGKAKVGKEYGDGDEASGNACRLPEAVVPPSVLASLELSSRAYAGWTYGNDASQRQIDCTRWVFAVLEGTQGSGWTKEQRLAIYERTLMGDLGEGKMAAADRDALIAAEDPRTKGVQTALVTAGKGTAIPAANAAPGDFVQFWLQSSSGSWRGHAGQIISVKQTKDGLEAQLLGSHLSKGRIAVEPITLVPATSQKATPRKMWVVRPSRS